MPWRSHTRAFTCMEDEALANGFTIIPNIVFKRRDLSAYAKLVYIALLSYAWQQDQCFPGQARLADELQISVDSVQRALRQLQDRGLLRITQRGQARRTCIRWPNSTRRNPETVVSGIWKPLVAALRILS